MLLGRPLGRALCLAVAICMQVATARAEPLRFHVEAGGARAISGPQERETGLGYTAKGAVELGLTGALGVQLEMSTASAQRRCDPPRDARLAARSGAGGQAVLGGFRLRPFVSRTMVGSSRALDFGLTRMAVSRARAI